MISSIVIAALCGLKDSINPCALVTLFFLLFFVSQLRKRRIRASWYAALFISAVFVSFLVIGLDALTEILYSPGFFKVARIFYFVTGVLMLAAGLLHLRDWWRMRRGEESVFFPLIEAPVDEPVWRIDIKIILGAVFAAALLSVFSTIWPPDPYISFYSSFLYFPGKLPETYAMLLAYNFAMTAPLLAAFVLTSSAWFAGHVRQNPSMVKIVLAAFALSFGAGLVYIFL